MSSDVVCDSAVHSTDPETDPIAAASSPVESGNNSDAQSLLSDNAKDSSAPLVAAVLNDATESNPKTLYIAGRAFTTKEELRNYVKKIEESVGEECTHDDPLSGKLSIEDSIFVFHLLLHHPRAVEKMVKPISHFRYGTYAKFKNKCFICVNSDGTQEGVSAAKSIQSIFPSPGGISTAVPGAGLVVGVTEERAAKRPREATDMGTTQKTETTDSRQPRVFKPAEMVRGSVIDFHGLPNSIDYRKLKMELSDYGVVRWLGLIRPAEESAAKKRRRGADGGAHLNAGEPTGELQATETVGPSADESAMEDSKKGQPTMESEVDKAAQGKDGDDGGLQQPVDGKEDSGEEEGDEELIIGRCRYDSPEDATAAAALTEVAGVPVRAVLLSGEEEETFWAQTNEKLKERFDNPDKGKGKKGKGKKGKGKGKGKSKGAKGRGGNAE